MCKIAIFEGGGICMRILHLATCIGREYPCLFIPFLRVLRIFRQEFEKRDWLAAISNFLACKRLGSKKERSVCIPDDRHWKLPITTYGTGALSVILAASLATAKASCFMFHLPDQSEVRVGLSFPEQRSIESCLSTVGGAWQKSQGVRGLSGTN